MPEIELPRYAREIFNNAVWKIARQIPPGKTASYGQIASYIPALPGIDPDQHHAFRARWAGSAMGVCPADVPWQRVINSQGKISDRPDADKQRRLLEAEGVVFDSRGRIDLKHFGWDGPTPEWLRENGLPVPGEPGAQPIG